MHRAAIGDLYQAFTLGVSEIAFQRNISLYHIHEFTLSLAVLTVFCMAALMIQLHLDIASSARFLRFAYMRSVIDVQAPRPAKRCS
jgi:hypothetical protein